MSVEWHPKGWWDWCMSEDEKKKKIHFLLKSAKSYQNDFIACQVVYTKWEYQDILVHEDLI